MELGCAVAPGQQTQAAGHDQSPTGANETEEEGRGGVLLSSLLLAVNLAKEVKCRGSK